MIGVQNNLKLSADNILQSKNVQQLSMLKLKQTNKAMSKK